MTEFSHLLSEKKLKKTPLRIAILEVFSEHSFPLSVKDIEQKFLETDLSPNQTSVYRQVESLKNANIIQEVETVSGTSFYELKQSHHHHFFCESCQKIECITDSLLEKSIHEFEEKLKKMGNEISGHHFSVSGKCKKCT